MHESKVIVSSRPRFRLRRPSSSTLVEVDDEAVVLIHAARQASTRSTTFARTTAGRSATATCLHD